MAHIEYLNFPSVPKHLLESVSDIIAKPPKPFSLISESFPYFKTRLVPDELRDFVQSLFDFKVYVQYQLVYNGLPIHRDLGNREIAYNYLLDTGGPYARTAIYDDNHNMIEEVALEPKRWHRIDTYMLHTVHGIEPNRVRVAISADLAKDYSHLHKNLK